MLENSSWGLLMLDSDLEELRDLEKEEGKDEASPTVGNRAIEIGPGRDELPS